MKHNLEGDLGEGQETKSKPLLVNQPSEADEFQRASPNEEGDGDAEAEVKEPEDFQLEDDGEDDD